MSEERLSFKYISLLFTSTTINMGSSHKGHYSYVPEVKSYDRRPLSCLALLASVHVVLTISANQSGLLSEEHEVALTVLFPMLSF